MKTNASADRFASFINLRVRDFSRAAWRRHLLASSHSRAVTCGSIFPNLQPPSVKSSLLSLCSTASFFGFGDRRGRGRSHEQRIVSAPIHLVSFSPLFPFPSLSFSRMRKLPPFVGTVTTCSSSSSSATPPSASHASSSGSLWVLANQCVSMPHRLPRRLGLYGCLLPPPFSSCAHRYPGRLLRRQLHQHHRCRLCEWAGGLLLEPFWFLRWSRVSCILVALWSADPPFFPSFLFAQKIRTIEMDGKTVKLQIVRTFPHQCLWKLQFIQLYILLVNNPGVSEKPGTEKLDCNPQCICNAQFGL
jgi:hypothetical protein